MDTPVRVSLSVQLLGGIVVSAADGREVTPPGKKLRALVACLALAPERGWSRERLTAVLWGDRDEDQARASLRQALAELRRLFGEPSPLRADRETVGLDTTTLTIDAVEFARLAAAGDLEQAAALYHGELLDGLNLPDSGFMDWLLIERTRLHDLAIDVLARLAASQNGASAIATAKRLLDLDPLREQTHRTLMDLYTETGQRAQALRQYQICRDNLQQGLGVKPEVETERLYKAAQARGREQGALAISSGPTIGPSSPITLDGSPMTLMPGSTAGEIKPRQRPAMLAAAVAVTVAALVVAGYVYRASTHGPQSAPVSAEAAIGLPMVLVLPFRNLTGDHSQDELGIGITEDLRNLLWNSPEFQVMSDTSRVITGDNAADTRETAQEFGANFVITGAVRRTGDKTLITAQLIDGKTGVHLWSDRFEETIADPVNLEKTVADRLSDSLGGMTGKMRRAYERVAWNKPEADLTEYDYYVRGHTFHHSFEKDEVLRARDIYQAGLERYPNSVLLRTKLSLIYVTGLWRWSEDVQGDAQKIRSYAREAAALLATRRSTRFEEYYVDWTLAYADHLDRNFPQCRSDAEAAVRLNPYDALLRADLASQEVECGNPGLGVAWAKEALRQEPYGLPDNPDFYRNYLVWALYLAARCQEALEVAKGMVRQPLMTVAACQVRLGDIGLGQRTMGAFMANSPDWTFKDEESFPFQMAEPLQQRWLDDIRAAGLPE